MYQGGCLCGAITYEFSGEPVKVSHCHCRMCQKQHGAAFATYARVREDELVYSGAVEHLASYSSSPGVVRKFCAICGSSLEWNAGPGLPEFTSISLASLDTPYQPESIAEIHTETRARWLSSECPNQATS
jgi:hypothetical protein